MGKLILLVALLGGCASYKYLQDQSDKAAQLAAVKGQVGKPGQAAQLHEESRLYGVKAQLAREHPQSALWEDVLLN